jgi:hypothetical protein
VEIAEIVAAGKIAKTLAGLAGAANQPADILFLEDKHAPPLVTDCRSIADCAGPGLTWHLACGAAPASHSASLKEFLPTV